jgi:hypothetical protein
MTVTDPCPGAPRHARSEIEMEIPIQGGPVLGHHGPPAGLGPWVPTLPEPEPQLSARALVWIGAVAVTLIIGLAAAVAVVIGSTAEPARTKADGLYLGSVRDNSSLTSTDVNDDILVRTGHAVCETLDRRPAVTTVLDTMRELGTSYGWGDGDVAAVVGSAIGAYCPRHMTLVGA